MSEPQTKEEELPTAGPAMMSYLRELAPFLAREGSTTTIGPDNSIKHSYKMPMQAKQALVNAREGNLPDWKGLNPEDIIALMGQRDKLDQQARQEPLDMNTLLSGAAQRQYQGQLGAAANPIHQLRRDFVREVGANTRADARDMTDLTRIENAKNMNQANIAGREKVANIYAKARMSAGGKQPSLLDLTDQLNIAMFNKKGEYIPPNPGEMDVLDGLFRQQGYKLVSLSLEPYKPWFSGNQPAQNAYFLTRVDQKPSQNTILQQLAKMGYKGLTAENIPELTGAQ
jgi:hypothetical protein